jgi:hypothetical protein
MAASNERFRNIATTAELGVNTTRWLESTNDDRDKITRDRSFLSATG